MVSIETKFKEIQEKHPFSGDYIIMCMAVAGEGYSEVLIKKYFKKLVSDDGWTKGEREELVEYLINVTNRLK
jgi:hypothetical protein